MMNILYPSNLVIEVMFIKYLKSFLFFFLTMLVCILLFDLDCLMLHWRITLIL